MQPLAVPAAAKQATSTTNGVQDFIGMCVGEGLPPVPERFAHKSDWGGFIEKCELTPEYWLAKEDGILKVEGRVSIKQ